MKPQKIFNTCKTERKMKARASRCWWIWRNIRTSWISMSVLREILRSEFTSFWATTPMSWVYFSMLDLLNAGSKIRWAMPHSSSESSAVKRAFPPGSRSSFKVARSETPDRKTKFSHMRYYFCCEILVLDAPVFLGNRWGFSKTCLTKSASLIM